MKSRLEGLRVYLSGPCERAIVTGETWRNLLTPKLKELGLIVLDPVNKNGVKLSFSKDNSEEFNYVKNLREKGEFEELTKCMKEVVHIDLRMVDCADIIITYLDQDIPTWGSIDEAVTACNQRKPVFICSKQGMRTIPLWLFGRIPLCYMFEDLDAVLRQLKAISICSEEDLKVLTDKRWLFTNTLGV